MTEQLTVSRPWLHILVPSDSSVSGGASFPPAGVHSPVDTSSLGELRHSALS